MKYTLPATGPIGGLWQAADPLILNLVAQVSDVA